jgi:hypothetical protein
MTEEVSDNQNRQLHENPTVTAVRKQYPAILILFLVFLGLVLLVFLTQHKETIKWVEDYDAGIRLAKQQNKPVLLAFYKANARFCEVISQDVYTNPRVIKYVEQNFVPIFIDVDKQPDIANRYHVDYYPTHYVKRPDNDELFGPILGPARPAVFIDRLESLLKKMKSS